MSRGAGRTAGTERFQNIRAAWARAAEGRRLRQIKVKPPSPSELVEQAARGPLTPLGLRDLTRIANDKRRGAHIRIFSANTVLRAAFGDPDNADG